MEYIKLVEIKLDKNYNTPKPKYSGITIYPYELLERLSVFTIQISNNDELILSSELNTTIVVEINDLFKDDTHTDATQYNQQLAICCNNFIESVQLLLLPVTKKFLHDQQGKCMNNDLYHRYRDYLLEFEAALIHAHGVTIRQWIRIHYGQLQGVATPMDIAVITNI